MTGAGYFLGVDGGGTKTEFLLIDAQGREIARHRGTTAYHLQIGLDGVRDVIAAGLDAICAQAELSRADLTYTFFGLPAYGEDRVIDPQLDQLCGELLGNTRYTCGNDMVCGWAGSLACEDGINIVAGTGSIGYGERKGQSARVGGWGEIFSDEGSAYWIAREGLNAFTRMADGRAEPGPLYDILRARMELESDIDLCARIMTEPPMPRSEIAALSEVISAAAEAGDAACRDILDRAGAELFDMACALRRSLGFASGESCPISWSGGAVSRITAVRDGFARRLASVPEFELVTPRHSPCMGAALYARHLAGHAALPQGA